MARRKKHNPEKRAWKGRSHKAAERRVRDLRESPTGRLPVEPPLQQMPVRTELARELAHLIAHKKEIF